MKKVNPEETPKFKVADKRAFRSVEEAESLTPNPDTVIDQAPTFVQELQNRLAEKDREIARFADAVRLQREEQKQMVQRLERQKQQEQLNLKASVIEPLL